MQRKFLRLFLKCSWQVCRRELKTLKFPFEIKWPLGGVHKLPLQDLSFFWPPTPLRLHFLWYKSLQKVNFFDHLPPSSCKRSLWTAPNFILFQLIEVGCNCTVDVYRYKTIESIWNSFVTCPKGISYRFYQYYL